MPFSIVRNDIVNMSVDAVVKPSSPRPVIGYGADTGIHQKAGPELLEARKRIGNIPVGGAAITPGYRLPARYVIHAVGPVWHGGGFREPELLHGCYVRSLELAKQQGCQSVAFPLLASGSNGFPRERALQIALNAINGFLMNNEMQVYLVVFNREEFKLSANLFRDISGFIDEHYVQEKNLLQYGVRCASTEAQGQQELFARRQQRRMQNRQEEAPQVFCAAHAPEAAPMPKSCFPAAVQRPAEDHGAQVPRKPMPSLAELLEETDAGFSETLLKLIDKSGKKDSEIYTRANVSRQHFSKIRNNIAYKPTKPTALAFAIALELDMEQTRDLIGRAGYALTNSSKFDVIIMYFIRQKHYNLMDINAALFEFDQSLLGA